jgi:hypothetical protein
MDLQAVGLRSKALTIANNCAMFQQATKRSRRVFGKEYYSG